MRAYVLYFHYAVHVCIFLVPSSNELNVLLNKYISLNFETEGMCDNTADGFVEHELMIVRHDGVIETFSLMNVKLHRPNSTEYSNRFTNNGFSYHGVCFFNKALSCHMIITFNPENNQYNGAEIIPLAHFPNCSKTINSSRTPVLNIQSKFSLVTWIVCHLAYTRAFIISTTLRECMFCTLLHKYFPNGVVQSYMNVIAKYTPII